MKKALSLFILGFLVSISVSSQDFFWKAGFNTFFDNYEFGKSEYKVPQTLSGLHLSPGVGLRWDSVHFLSAGVSLVHSFGSREMNDNIYLTAYYELRNKPFRFLMGAFPRNVTIQEYPRVFFQDSVAYYRPNINGIFWEIRRDGSWINLWLDWTGLISVQDRETFFMGFSGNYSPGSFYLRHFGYMFHYAGDLDPFIDRGVYDNGLFLTSAGLNLTDRLSPFVLDISAGWLSGAERSRSGQNKWIINNGLLVEALAGYRKFGLKNTLYLGDGQMAFYEEHSNNLYWGDPIYRAGNYNRTDFWINFINRNNVDLRLTYSLHFAEGRIYHEQILKATVNINNLK